MQPLVHQSYGVYAAERLFQLAFHLLVMALPQLRREHAADNL